MAKAQHIAIADIRTEGMQTRVSVDREVVREYGEAEKERGAVLPPVLVYLDRSGVFWLADGFHRLEVARQNGRKKVACEVREGSRVDALRFALGANAAHGLRRTSADKAHAVKLAYEHRIELGLGEVPAANAVAELVGVSNHFAANQLGTVPSWREASERVGTDGKVRTVPPVPTRKPTKNGVFKADKGEATRAELPPPPVRASRASAHEAGSAAKAGSAGELPPPPVRGSVRAEHGSEGPWDGRGKTVPPHLVALWNRRGECAEIAKLVSRVRVALENAEKGQDPLWSELNFSSVRAHLERAYTEITAAHPWCVCPMCQGFGCKACKGRGLMGEYRFEIVVPRNMQ